MWAGRFAAESYKIAGYTRLLPGCGMNRNFPSEETEWNVIRGLQVIAGKGH